jgi:hypothetical protein
VKRCGEIQHDGSASDQRIAGAPPSIGARMSRTYLRAVARKASEPSRTATNGAYNAA